MSENKKREEVLLVYENLKTALTVLAGKLGHDSLTYPPGKMTSLAVQASAELYLAAACIRRGSLGKDEQTGRMKIYIREIVDAKPKLVDFGPIVWAIEQLADIMLTEGHKKLCGHLRGTATYLHRVYCLYCKAHDMKTEWIDTLRLMFLNRRK